MSWLLLFGAAIVLVLLILLLVIPFSFAASRQKKRKLDQSRAKQQLEAKPKTKEPAVDKDPDLHLEMHQDNRLGSHRQRSQGTTLKIHPKPDLLATTQATTPPPHPTAFLEMACLRFLLFRVNFDCCSLTSFALVPLAVVEVHF